MKTTFKNIFTFAIGVVTFYSSFAQDNLKLKIELFQNTFSDETIIGFNNNATENFDNNFDALNYLDLTQQLLLSIQKLAMVQDYESIFTQH